MNLTFPLNFGERPCDRMLLAILRDGPRASIQWASFMIWKDFGIARDDRREVPLDPAARAKCQAVAIIEQFAGWDGDTGKLVEAAIQAGFFTLTAITETAAELVLVDFFPANHSAAREISNSALGGINKGINIAKRAAESDTKEQLDFFQQNRHSLLETHGKDDLKAALLFINQICNVLRRPRPAAAEWRATLTVKSLDVLAKSTAPDREAAFKWFVKNRSSQDIPPRLDFIIDRFPDFIARGLKDFPA